jgi:hypothetical protein
MLLDFCGPSSLVKSVHGRDRNLSVVIEECRLDLCGLFISGYLGETQARKPHLLSMAIHHRHCSFVGLIPGHISKWDVLPRSNAGKGG